jgi:hypothetical protein
VWPYESSMTLSKSLETDYKGEVFEAGDHQCVPFLTFPSSLPLRLPPTSARSLRSPPARRSFLFLFSPSLFLRFVVDLPFHSFNFSFLVPSSTAVSQRSVHGRIRHYVKAFIEFDGGRLGSNIVSSAPTAVWIAANPSPPGELPSPTDISFQHYSEDLGRAFFLSFRCFRRKLILYAHSRRNLGHFSPLHHRRSLQRPSLASRPAKTRHHHRRQRYHHTNFRGPLQGREDCSSETAELCPRQGRLESESVPHRRHSQPGNLLRQPWSSHRRLDLVHLFLPLSPSSRRTQTSTSRPPFSLLHHRTRHAPPRPFTAHRASGRSRIRALSRVPSPH